MKKRSWLSVIFVFIASLSPRLKRFLWKWWYNLLAQKDTGEDLLLMNYGYASDDLRIMLYPEDEPYRYSLQLYDHVVDGVDLSGKNVLEVGSGRGGGAGMQPAQVVGVDLSMEAVLRSRVVFERPNLSFKQGAAEDLPVLSESMDVVVNVESSHCYPDMGKFLQEVMRVLHPGGYFAFCDMRSRGDMGQLREKFRNTGFEVVKWEDITPNVLKALDHVADERGRKILEKVPPFLRACIADFTGLKGTAVYNLFQDGKYLYVCALLRKPAA